MLTPETGRHGSECLVANRDLWAHTTARGLSDNKTTEMIIKQGIAQSTTADRVHRWRRRLSAGPIDGARHSTGFIDGADTRCRETFVLTARAIRNKNAYTWPQRTMNNDKIQLKYNTNQCLRVVSYPTHSISPQALLRNGHEHSIYFRSNSGRPQRLN